MPPALDAQQLAALVAELRAEVRGLSERLLALEQQRAVAPTPEPPAAPAEVPEEEMLVIAAAVAAFLGQRARIRQVRLIQSSTWAQVGRATVHASHRVH